MPCGFWAGKENTGTRGRMHWLHTHRNLAAQIRKRLTGLQSNQR